MARRAFKLTGLLLAAGVAAGSCTGVRSAKKRPIETCYEESIWKLVEGEAIEYRARVASPSGKRPIAEYYKRVNPGEPEYPKILQSALDHDKQFAEKRVLSVNLVYPCDQAAPAVESPNR